MRNYILYHLYKILYLFSFGKKRKKFYDKFKGLKREYCKEKEWNKNYVKWSKNNNKLIIIDDTGKAQETD
ncbi:MAG: hypothetical protein K2I05_03560, partial [Mailhella sp.]|nr:hypothetical protein [Mailhella sp.]